LFILSRASQYTDIHIPSGEVDVLVLHYRVPDGAGVHVQVCYKVNLEAGSLLDDGKQEESVFLPRNPPDAAFSTVPR
jgi:hypothetical protein